MATAVVSQVAKPAQSGSGKKLARRAAPKRRVRGRTSRKRKVSTPAERAKILAVASRERLTAQQVQQRFGVKPVTYYSWRKASKKQDGRSRTGRGGVWPGLDLAGQVRQALRAQIAAMLPEIIEEEVGNVLRGQRGRGR